MSSDVTDHNNTLTKNGAKSRKKMMVPRFFALLLVMIGASVVLYKMPLSTTRNLKADTPQTYTVTNTNDSGAGSLRTAITSANSNAAGDTIVFESTLSGSINILSELPELSDAQGVTIDGTTAQDAVSGPDITVNGGGGNFRGLVISSSGNTIKGLKITNLQQDGLNINGSNNIIGGTGARDRNVLASTASVCCTTQLIILGGSNNQIIGNYIGVDSDGSTLAGNPHAALLVEGGSNNVIGGSTTAHRNVIGGGSNGNIGISNATNTLIQNNYIGVNAAGTGAIGNTPDVGIQLAEESDGTQIIQNVVSGSTVVALRTNGADNVSFKGNYVGTNAAGTAAIANDGTIGRVVMFDGSSTNFTIGGTDINDATTRNLISGNTTGMALKIEGSSSGIVQGNYIGLKAGGTAALSNQAANVEVNSTAAVTINNNVISGSTTGEGILVNGSGVTTIINNYIGTNAAGTAAIGNKTDGIRIESSGHTINNNVISGTIESNGIRMNVAAVSNITIKGNKIGTKADGTGSLGNAGDGIVLGANVTNITIGGTGAGEGNVIANSGNRGILLSDGTIDLVTMRANTVFNNTNGNISFASGANNNISSNATAISSANVKGINGTSTLGENTAVDVFVDNSGGSALKKYIGTAIVNANGNWDLSAGIGTGVISVMATNTQGRTAAPSPTVTVTSFVVNSTNDADDGVCDGTHCSLREAINASNATVQGDRITFSVSGAITIFNALNALSSQEGVDLDGNGAITLESTAGSDNNIFNITGKNYNIRGFTLRGENSISGDGNTIGGTDPTDRNIFITPTNGKHLTINSSNNKIINNYFGLQSDGVTISAANDGIALQSGTNNTIGGATASERNVFSGMVSCGINFTGNAGATIYGNYLGLKADGSNKTNPVITNGICFAQNINYTNSIKIGGFGSGEGNVISGASQKGIILGGTLSNILIQGNYIGTNTAGTAALGNQIGIALTNSPVCSALGNCIIGGTNSGARNIISGNTNDGIQVLAGASNWQIINNYIGTNAAGTLAVANSFHGVEIQGGSNIQVGDGTGANYNVISGNAQVGVFVTGPALNVTISSNYIGTNAAGTAPIANGSAGISTNGATNPVTIGTITATAPTNVISGNTQQGINVGQNSPTVNIYSSIIGLNAAQNGTIPNALDGIIVSDNANTGMITIGNTRGAGFNVIAGNGTSGTMRGINVSNGFAPGTIKGNYIGVNSAMTTVFRNLNGGILVSPNNGTTQWNIGGTNAGEGNVISGHITTLTAQGAEIQIASGATGAKITGNYLGVDINGNALGGASVGILDQGTNTEIGSSTGNGRNHIGNMGEAAIVVASTTGTKIVNNHIGVKPNGTSIAGAGHGIVVKQKTTQSTNITIGGSATNEGNFISNWGQNGINIKGVKNVTILGNVIGLNPAGDTDFGNGHGIFIEEGTNENIYIGRNADKTVYKANIISGNNGDGIRIQGTGTINVVKIAGNKIGTNGTGTGMIGNTGDGIHIENGTSLFIGAEAGLNAQDPNIIGGNGGNGIDIFGSTANIQANYIGVGTDKITNLGNGDTGIKLSGGASNAIIGFTYSDTIPADGTQNMGNNIGFNGASINPKSILLDGNTTNNNSLRGNIMRDDQNILFTNGANANISTAGTTIGTATTTTLELTTNLVGKCDVYNNVTSSGAGKFEGTVTIANGKCTMYKDFSGNAGDKMVVQITQADGNSTPFVTKNIVDDMTPPAQPIVTSSVGSSTAAYTFTGTKEPYSSLWYQLNGSSAVEAIPVDSTTTWSLPVTLLAGDNSGTFTSKDFAGNTSVATVFPVNYKTTSTSSGTTSGGSSSGSGNTTTNNNQNSNTQNDTSTNDTSTTEETNTTESSNETTTETTTETPTTTESSGGSGGSSGTTTETVSGGSGGGENNEQSATEEPEEEETITEETESTEEEETVEGEETAEEIPTEETQTPVAIIDEQLGVTVKEGEAPEWWLEVYDLEKEEFTTTEDSDADGVSNIDEYSYGTDPNSTDSDNDKLTDAEEVSGGTDPLSADSDGDGLSDYAELVNGTDPYNPDTDGDGYSDGAEAGSHESDPTSALSVPYDADGDGYTERYTGAKGGTIDSDSDGITDILEYGFHTDPYDPDSDKDGVTDGAEILVYGTDPDKAEELNVEDIKTYIANWKNGDISGENKPLVIGIAPAGSHVELVYVQEEFSAVLGTGKSSTDGTFTITTESELIDGDYYLFARSRNATSGTIINQSYPIKLTINTTTLDTESIAPQKLDGKEITDGEVITVTSMRPLLEVQSQLGLTVHVYWKSFLLASAVLADIDPWQTEPPSDLDVGLHTVYIQAEDSNNVKGKVHEVQFAVTPLETLHGSLEDKTTLVITVLGILGILAISLMAFYGRKKQKEVNAIAETGVKPAEGVQEAPVRTTIVTQTTPAPQDLPKMEVKDTLNAAVHPDDIPSDTKSADQNS